MPHAGQEEVVGISRYARRRGGAGCGGGDGLLSHLRVDVGVAGIHRFFPCLERMMGADALVVAAGREGTLPAVVPGLVEAPVISLPVSTGYGLGGRGQAALYSMLQSCSVLTVVNIDAGFVAGAYAAKIARQKADYSDRKIEEKR